MNAGPVFSVLTPSGRGAVAVVAVSGTGTTEAVGHSFLAWNGRLLAELPLSKIVYGHWGSRDGEDIVVCRREVDHIEIHCHGGTQSVARIRRDLIVAGCREIPWQAWLERHGDCPISVEARIALASAISRRTALILLDQFHGALRQEVLEIVKQFESDPTAAKRRLEKLLETAELGEHLTRPWQVVVAGQPNVGKSSLVNALVGYQRAIVFDQPGTTRDVVTASTVADGWPIQLSDTAGLHESTDEIEVAGIELARQRLADADLIIWVHDATNGTNDVCIERQMHLPTRQLLVVNKVDLAAGGSTSRGAILTSATEGTGIDDLLVRIVETLVPQVPSRESAILFTERQVRAVKAALESCQAGQFDGAVELLSKLLEVPACGD